MLWRAVSMAAAIVRTHSEGSHPTQKQKATIPDGKIAFCRGEGGSDSMRCISPPSGAAALLRAVSMAAAIVRTHSEGSHPTPERKAKTPA